MYTFFIILIACIVLLASKYNIFWCIKKFYHYTKKEKHYDNDGKQSSMSFQEIILVESSEKCDYAVQRVRCDATNCVLGFDCEWVNDKPVSLIQLATPNGVCALFRIGKIGYVPSTLQEILADNCILKVGVAAFEDGQRLLKDYNIEVLGTLDLRKFADYFDPPSPKSLAALSSHYLGIRMDKVTEVRCGDWDADTLTDQQIAYAACDALASILVYQKIKERGGKRCALWKNLINLISKIWGNDKSITHHHLPPGLLDQRFRIKQSNNINKIKINNIGTPKHKIPTRNKPLYYNCYLQAPDGETLCTCDYNKAEWYVKKNLGEIVEREPFTVKLKFEPSGRALGEVGQYYIQVKVNQCVVCGNSNSFVRKNVVPREYRKYFPVVMKDHQSHDILLLCPSCHEVSNCHDLQLRRDLADMCGAPLFGPMTNVKDENLKWKKMESAVKLLLNSSRISTEKRQALEAFVLENSGEKYLTVELLEKLDQDFKNKSFPIVSSRKSDPHGSKVVEFFKQEQGGLLKLERIWREHFVDTMNPQYLPNLWSIEHNHQRLMIRQTQNRIEPNDAKIAGIVDTNHIKGIDFN